MLLINRVCVILNGVHVIISFINRERYPPRKLVMQSTTVIPRIKFSQKAAAAATDSSPSKPSGRPRVGYFDIRVIEVGVTCPLSDLPEPPTTPRKIQVGNVATTTGILVSCHGSNFITTILVFQMLSGLYCRWKLNADQWQVLHVSYFCL